ncbi:MAG: aminopeptidase, partial [Pseudomonadota bacterium]|nr:aminopeptidase [Pseudomonadota bacterium]
VPVVPSVLRDFSAPVKLKLSLADDDLAFLMAHDGDEFNRWNAAQQLGVNVLLHMIEAYKKGHPEKLPPGYLTAFSNVLSASGADKALMARVLTLPDEDYLAELMPYIDVDSIHMVRESACREIAEKFQPSFQKLYAENQQASYLFNSAAIGKRCLKNMCLNYLVRLNTDTIRKMAVTQYYKANNMSDQITALRALVHIECDEKTEILHHFYEKWRADSLVIDKWFMVQATASLPSTLNQVEKLLHHEAFDITVPNRARALIGAFSQSNPVCFHESTGRGYRLLTDAVMKLNTINPQIAARLVSPLIQWRRYDASRQRLMKAQLGHIAAMPDLSRDVYEIVNRGLQT